MADTPAYSPLWWLEKLGPKLDQQALTCRKFEAYYNGLQTNWSMTTAKYQQYFRQMLGAVSDNWMPIVVDATAERLNVQGFRMGTRDADDDAWNIWQYNNMDLLSDCLHTSVLTCGLGFITVWKSEFDNYPVLLSPEHPCEVYVAIAPGNRKRVAAIKRWFDEWTGETRADIYLPDGIYKFLKVKDNWQLLESLPNPLGVIPIVPFFNRTSLRVGSYRSEIADVLSTQDQINKLVVDMMIASEFGAFRQRWMTGVDIPLDENGKPVETFKSMTDRIWILEDPDARMGEFQATDLTNYVSAIESRVQSLASRSRTPPHYLLGQSGSFPSGESIKSTEAGLTSKSKKHMKEYGEPYEETMSLAFAVMDDPRSQIRDSEVIWADPETRTESEHVDALMKLRGLNVPIEQLWLDAGYTPPQIEQFKDLLRQEALLQGMSAPITVSVNGGNGPQPKNPIPAALPSGTATP